VGWAIGSHTGPFAGGGYGVVGCPIGIARRVESVAGDQNGEAHSIYAPTVMGAATMRKYTESPIVVCGSIWDF